MYIKTGISYNLDLICFLNTMTGDQYYTKFHKDEFDRFYNVISSKTKQSINDMVKKQGYSMLSPTLTLFLSSMSNFNNRNIKEMFQNFQEIETSMNQTEYKFTHDEFSMYFSFFEDAITPLIDELEMAGFYSFWEKNKLPQIKMKCGNVNKYMEQYSLEKIINQFKNIDNSDFSIYICSFAKPHGIKLCGNNIISDFSYSNQAILSNVTHEVFHPAFSFETVADSLQVLANKPWVKEAFNKQNPNSGYYEIEGFIEEHIVEALGIYVMVQLGADINPTDYFKIHDEGSHVISPYFYDYLCNNRKDPLESFENYFIKFVDTITD